MLSSIIQPIIPSTGASGGGGGGSGGGLDIPHSSMTIHHGENLVQQVSSYHDESSSLAVQLPDGTYDRVSTINKPISVESK